MPDSLIHDGCLDQLPVDLNGSKGRATTGAGNVQLGLRADFAYFRGILLAQTQAELTWPKGRVDRAH